MNKKGKKVNFKGNEIEFGELKVIPWDFKETLKQQRKMFLITSLPDSVPAKEWTTANLKMERVMIDIVPVLLNGKRIYGSEEQYFQPEADAKYTSPVFSGAGVNADQYLFAQLKNDLDKLENGSYILRVNNLVINDKGNIAYYENAGIDFSWREEKKNPLIADDVKHTINEKLVDALDHSIQFKPALKSGKPVNVRLVMGQYQIEVKNHKAQLVERAGC